MRRVVGAVLLALGMFMVVVAVMLPTYIASNLVTTPLDQYTVSVATAKDATVFNSTSLKLETGVPVEATRTVRPDVKKSTDDVVVFDAFLVVEDTRTDRTIDLSSDRVGIDRKTGAAQEGFGAAVNEEPTSHKGGEIYKFPFGTEKKSYPYFDTTIRDLVTAKYVSTEKVSGVETYKFQMEVPATKTGTLNVPGEFVGSPEADVDADRFYANTRTVWVDPVTGVIVKGEEQQKQTLRDAQGQDKLTLFEATLTFDQQTIDENVKLVKDFGTQITLVKTVAPLVVGVLGVILAIVGLILLVRGRAQESSYRPTRPSPSGERPKVRS